MRLEGLIAARYLFGRRQKSVVSIISWISVVGLLVSTAALIVVLSVYNGIGNLTRQLFATFDAELVVEPATGKTFDLASMPALQEVLQANADVAVVSQVVDEMAWITYGANQAIVSLRGVDQHYHKAVGIDTMIFEGSYQLDTPPASTADGYHTLVVGGEIYYQLGMRLHQNHPATLLIPRRGTTQIGHTIDQAFRTAYAYPTAYFFIQNDIDQQYVLTDADLVRSLLGYSPTECTSLALQLQQSANTTRCKKRLQAAISSANLPLVVKDRTDQQPLYFKIFRTERLGIYLILSLIVLISTLSLVASLSLLIINKEADIFTLRSMGFTRARVRRTFVCEGMLIAAVATLGGLLIGFVVCYLQQRFGIIRMGDGNFVVQAFPVAMRPIDFLITFLLVLGLSGIAVSLTVNRSRI